MAVKPKKYAQPELPPGEEKAARYLGPWFQIEADAKVSRNYTGKVDLGRYTLQEKNKGILGRRIEALTLQNYKNLNVREIPKETLEVEVYPEDTPSKIGRKKAA